MCIIRGHLSYQKKKEGAFLVLGAPATGIPTRLRRSLLGRCVVFENYV